MSASDHWSRRFDSRTLGRRLLSMPLVVMLLPFILGIALAERVVLPLGITAVLGSMLLVAVWLLRERRVVWLYAAMLLLLVGYVVAELRSPRTEMPYDSEVSVVVDVDGEPQQRADYALATGRVVRWGGVCDADCRVQLWVRDTVVAEGDRLYCVATLRERMSRSVEYDELLHRRGYVGGIALNKYNIDSIVGRTPTSLHSRSVSKLRRYAHDTATHATVEAMVTGSRRMMPQPLREAYSLTGLAHLMAVSGLHLGIVAMVVGWLLAPLRLIHRGHRLAALISIVVLWLFAVMSGLSPSVVRSAIMFSVLMLSKVSSWRYNSLNSLAATVLLMLVYRPDYLYDLSFQLSVTAVFGIVAWSVPLQRAVRTKSRALSWLLASIVVGVVATLWTLPIVSHSFGNIPIVGVVATPFALITTTLIIGFGLVALLLPDPLAIPFAEVAEWSAALQNWVVEWFAQLSWASCSYSLSECGVAIYYLLFVVITLGVWSINRKKVVTLSEYDEYRRHRTS